jgi:hypothetical protein
MEVFLNSIWLVLAITAVLFWQTEGKEGALERREHNSRYRFLVLACALILLFPVISVTDDLHGEQAVMEDSSRSVMKARQLAQGGLRAGKSSFPALLVAIPDHASAPFVVTARVARNETRVPRLNRMSPGESRAPPL